jgi:hypothetical protein
MATGTPADYASKNPDREKPNHMIFWLDVTIGNPNEYVHLKKAFRSNTDPSCETFTMLTDKDYDAIIATGDAVPVTFEGVEFLLQAFNNEDACLEAFKQNEDACREALKQNEDKRIFFITSGSLGRSIVPKIIERYRHIFTDPITDKPYASVYVFCHNIEYHMEWGMNYLEYVQMFNFDSALLARMTRDIAEYFIERGKRIRQDNDLEGALQRLNWAKKLWYQYDKMQQKFETDNSGPVRESEGSKKIDKLIDEVEEDLRKKMQDDDN